jgi:hypothetical protein
VLTHAKLSVQVADATADSKQKVQSHYGRSLHMIIELGKVTEETQNQTVVPDGIDFFHYRVEG